MPGGPLEARRATPCRAARPGLILVGGIVAILAMTPAANAGTLIGVNVTAASVLAGTTTTWTFDFTTATAIPLAGGDIRIVFPGGFEAALTSTCTIVGKAATTTTVTLPNEVVCNLVANTLAAPEAVSLTITNVKNPTTAQITGTFTIQTRDAVDAVVDSHTTNTEVINPNALTGVTISAPLQTTGIVETWTFSFTVSNAVSGNGDLRLVFPAGFQTSSGGATVCDVTAPLTVTSETTTVVSATEVLCNLGAADTILAGTTVTLTLTNVKNPQTVQTTGAFGLQTRNSADAVHDQDTSNTESIVASTLSSVSASAPLQTAGAVETWTIIFTTTNAAPASGDVRVVFPSGFQTSASGTTTCDIIGKTTETTSVIGGTEVVCNLNSASLGALEAVTMTLSNVKNPTVSQVTGAFTIQTRDAADAVIDSHSANVETIAPNLLLGVSVSSPYQAVRAVETWTISFVTANPVGAGGDVIILFPSGFQLSYGGSTLCDISATAGETTAILGSTIVVCELGANTLSAGQAVTLTLTNILNPYPPQTTGAFAIQTRNAADAIHDQHLTNVETLVAGALRSLAVSAPTQAAGATEIWTIAFTPAAFVPASGDVRVVFPGGFQTSSGSATICDLAGKTSESTTVVGAAEVVCNLNAESLASSGAVSLTLTNVRNPRTAGVTGAFTIQTRDGADAMMEQDATNTESVVAHAFSVAPSAGASELAAGVVANYTFTFAPYNTWGSTGSLRIVFPSGYAFNPAGIGSTSVTSSSGSVGTFGAPSISGQTLAFPRLTGSDTTGGTLVTVVVSGLRNPTVGGTTGPFTLSTLDSAGAVHDSGSIAGVAIVGVPASPGPSPNPTPSPSPNETVPPDGGDPAEPKAAGPPSPKVFTLPGFGALAAALALGLFAWSYRRRRRRR